MSMTYGDLFAANMRAARARANLSQTAVAKRMKRLGFGSWSGGKVSECERGDRAVVAAELLALAVSLECTLVDLVGQAPVGSVVTFPDERFVVSGTTVRNSGSGWMDYAVTWPDDPEGYPVITMPANPHSARAWDKTHLLSAS